MEVATSPAPTLSSISGVLSSNTPDAVVSIADAPSGVDSIVFKAPAADVVSITETTHEPVSMPWNTIAKYAGVIIVLGLLGLNIFRFLENATDSTVGFLRPVLAAFGYGAGETIKSTTNVLGAGAKGTVDVATGVVQSVTNLAQQGLGVEGKPHAKATDINKKLDAATVKNEKKRVRPPPEGDISGSSTQSSRGSKRKGGFCFIGADDGVRSCVRVMDRSECMSGDIFPSRAICMNPSLRE